MYIVQTPPQATREALVAQQVPSDIRARSEPSPTATLTASPYHTLLLYGLAFPQALRCGH